MNQLVGFMVEMEEPILRGIKYYTTREETEYRLKLDVGDTMYMYVGIRTPQARKFAEAIVVNRWQWSILLPKTCPIGITWEIFSKTEGFNNINELKDFFIRKLITYQFKLKDKKDWIKK